MPFTIDVEESAHQIPFSPIIPPRMIASGILALVKAILIILQSRVLPSPDNAPTVVNSTLQSFAETYDDQIFNCCCNCRWFMERSWQSALEHI